MDNIKKFEDFLDRMQGLLDEAKKCGHIIVRVEDLENAFPELEEREDERIRQALIEMIYETPSIECEEDYNLSKEDILTWLEKQGKTFTKKDIDEVFVERACDAYCNLCDTKECVNIGECDWVERFRKLLRR